MCSKRGGMCGKGGHAWQRRGGMHGRGMYGRGVMHGRRESHCSRQYASYWNAFLFSIASINNRQNGSVTHFDSEILCQKMSVLPKT